MNSTPRGWLETDGVFSALSASCAVAVPATISMAAVMVIAVVLIYSPICMNSKSYARKSRRSDHPLRLPYVPAVMRRHQRERSAQRHNHRIHGLHDSHAKQIDPGRPMHRVDIAGARPIKALHQEIGVDGGARQRGARRGYCDRRRRFEQLQRLDLSSL